MKDERRGTEYICLPQNTRFLSNKRQKIPRNSTKSWNIFINCLGFRGFQFKEIWYVFMRWLWLYFDLCTVNMFDSNKVYIFLSSHVKVHLPRYFNIELLFRYRFVPIKYHDLDKVLILVSFLIYFIFQILLQILFEK